MIEYVQMINWRAYDQHEVHFGPGITFIMGANGIGKTSILEAIAYGLTGEPSTVKHRPKLLRDPGKLATVRLSFAVDRQTYLVERSQSQKSAERATLIRVEDGKRLASSHRRVTQAIEELMGVSADFLQRIVYMAEGDVFRFLDKPPGQALDLQIRQVLGLTQLDEFVQALGMAEKELKEQIRAVQGLLADCERLGIRQDPDFEHHMEDMDKRRECLLAELRAAQDEIARHKHEYADLERLTELLDRALPCLRRDPDTWQSVQRQPIVTLFGHLEEQASQLQSTIQQCQVDLARLEGERSTHQDVLDILEPYVGQLETAPCPVCSKPMTSSERDCIIRDIQGSVDRIGSEARELDERRSEAIQALNRLRWQMDALRELRNVVAHTRVRFVSAQASVVEMMQVIRSRPASIPADLEEQASALERQIAQLESERAEYLAARHRLQNLGYDSPEEASAALVGLETRSLSLRAAHRAAQETLTTQRNVDMAAIYDQVARVWEVFTGDAHWRIELDTAGMPTLQDGKGRQLDLSQVSGGEKTALLIMLHTIIAHHFSRSDFLLIDEPLEHLDPINRRSLIRFLVGAYRRGSFEQAIVATFEESLIRKYMSEEGVKVIHL
jgi:DNA repair exonuclease SbcCD ATPase subunit